MQHSTSENGLDRLFARVPLEEQAAALEELATSLRTENDLTVASWLLSRPATAALEGCRHAVYQFLGLLLREKPLSVVAFCATSPEVSQWALQAAATDLKQKHKSLVTLVEASEGSEDHDFDHDVDRYRAGEQQAIDGVADSISMLDIVHERSTKNGQLALDISLLDLLLQIYCTWLKRYEAMSSNAGIVLRKWMDAVAQHPTNQETLQEVQERLWHYLGIMCIGGVRSDSTKVFRLWWYSLNIQTISNENNEFRSRHFLSDTSWSTLQDGLLIGDTEVRRNVLRILRMSIDFLARSDVVVDCQNLQITESNRARVARSMERFCTVFETIVMGRYINQVRELELDLAQLAGPTAVLPRSWLLTVLQPAMSNKMQDSIRNFIGNWILDADLSAPEHGSKLDGLLRETLLPWITRGASYVNTIRGTTDDLISTHGQRVSAFFRRLLKEMGDRTQRSHITTIVNYLAKVRHNTMAFAIVCILHGVQQAVSDWAPQAIVADTLYALGDIASTPGLPEVQRDLIVVLCREISTKLFFPGRDDRVKLKLEPVQEHYRRLVEPSPKSRPESPQWRTLDDLQHDIDLTRSNCLKGSGLLDACACLGTIPSSEDAALSATKLAKIFDSVWEQVEIQDYPKVVLLEVPALFLHPRSIGLTSQDESLRDQVVFFVREYHKLFAGRIYTWTPFMVSLRRAVLSTKDPSDTLNTMNISDIVDYVVRSPPTAKPEFQLDAAAANTLSSFSPATSHLTYEHYYGSHEEVGWAAFFDLVAHLDSADTDYSLHLLDKLLEPWIKQRIPAVIVNQWKTTEWLQTVLILLESSQLVHSVDLAGKYAQTIMYLLSVEPLPRYRFLLEWMLCRLIIKHKLLIDLVIDVLSSIDHHGNPKYLASIVKVAISIICSSIGDETMATRVIPRLAGLAASSKIIIRHEAQWALPAFWKHAELNDWKTVLDNHVVRGLMDYIHSLERTIVPAPERENSRFDLDHDHTLATLLSGSYLGLEPTVMPRVEEQDFSKLFELDGHAVNKVETSLCRNMPVGNKPRARVATAYSDVPKEKKAVNTEDIVALQTKGTSYLGGTVEDLRKKRVGSGLLVVGSLVDNPYNLGGLSRVSEIFGAAALYVANTKVLTHKDFESVAVSSHMHFDVKDLPVAEMVDFFSSKRLEGYCIVGIEQTDRSKLLGQKQTILPEKTILVLGAEREGMPAEILAVCDLLVEIPQKGSTRSLNVQTAAACVLFDYCRQHQ
ncbi:hypothetical protein BDZ85DRAFT_71056 [Elsinoe ampelina]|uniref:tRNA/rRNA methyltransferase SpoU type domain-containing protein n=1 Tax=Elsinoe ampelina TaxID=302913 RepID=A0A6A6GJ58_9PEZI|nr:hypothetical protein BDZ85DRAFT_71056 [Elsinoe ampelina]